MKGRLDRFLKKKTKRTDPEAPQNEYYENISAGLGILQVVLYFSLLAFVFISFLTNTELITYQNFYYFFKDLNASAEAVDILSAQSVSYPTSPTQSFALYRQGLAVAGTREVTVFTATGRQTVSQSIQYQNPVAVGSGKYLLVYESGGTRYSLYNSYTQIHTGVSDFPIISASVSDSGMYAIVSSSEEYSSVVSLYTSHFSLLNRYNKNGFVMDVAINEKGSLIAILTSYPLNGTFQSRLEIYKPGATDVTAVSDVGEALALSCSFTSSARLAILTDRGISYVDQAGRQEAYYDFSGRQLAHAVVDSSGVAVCLKQSPVLAQTELVVLDQNGETQLIRTHADAIAAMARYQNALYFISGNSVVRLDLKNGEQVTQTQNTEQRTLLAVSETEALLCSPQKAEYFYFK